MDGKSFDANLFEQHLRQEFNTAKNNDVSVKGQKHEIRVCVKASLLPKYSNNSRMMSGASIPFTGVISNTRKYNPSCPPSVNMHHESGKFVFKGSCPDSILKVIKEGI